ncbi:MAG: hypothetical protein J7J15_00775, partial [Candidatus Aenigmarchaeota archaeon]|nr:hypothetical protein [Candidatus Aenigmarchaeota archaeon]
PEFPKTEETLTKPEETELEEKPEFPKTEETLTKPEETELEEKEKIDDKIREIEDKISEMKKMGIDTTEFEKELKSAKEDLNFGLSVLAEDTIDRILKKLKEY